MKLARFLLIVAYGSYLTNVGLVLLLLPWTDTWTYIILKFPPEMTFRLDHPAVRGAISAFGLLHLIMIFAEFIVTPSLQNPNQD